MLIEMYVKIVKHLKIYCYFKFNGIKLIIWLLPLISDLVSTVFYILE